MDEAGLELERLTHRLAECPADFLAEPRGERTGTVHVAAVVSDLLVDLGGAPLTAAECELFQRSSPGLSAPLRPLLAKMRGTGRTPTANRAGEIERNYLRTVLIACWLFHDLWFRERRRFAEPTYAFLRTGLVELAALVPAATLVTDPDRREELVRLALQALGLRPAGETVAQALDRLTTLDTAERQRVISAARAAEERSRAIRAAMAKKAAEEAAAKYARE